MSARLARPLNKRPRYILLATPLLVIPLGLNENIAIILEYNSQIHKFIYCLPNAITPQSSSILTHNRVITVKRLALDCVVPALIIFRVRKLNMATGLLASYRGNNNTLLLFSLLNIQSAGLTTETHHEYLSLTFHQTSR